MRLILLLLFVAGAASRLSACHALALMNPSVITTSTGIVINANSDPATYLCGPHTMQVELSATGQFTGNPPPFSSSQWSSFPWYQSLLNIANYGPPQWQDDPLLEPYTTITIPFSALCAGTTMYVRLREFVVGSNSAGPWTQSFIVNVPGTTPVLTGVVSTLPSDCNICNGTASLVITGGTSPYSYSWPNGDTASGSAPYCIGTYPVFAHDAVGCPVTAQFVIGDSCLLGINTESAAGISIFPNPAHDFIAVAIAQAAATSWVIVDASGRMVKQETLPIGMTNFIIHTADLPAGNYYLQLISEGRSSVRRFSVVH